MLYVLYSILHMIAPFLTISDCDNVLQNGGGPAPDGNALCDMTCDGNTAEICGGPNRLSLYQFVSGGVVTTPNPTTTAKSTTKSTTAPTTAPTSKSTGSPTTTSKGSTVSGSGTATNLPAGWQYSGCWVDNANGRILPVAEANNAALTIENCIAYCVGQSYTVAGLEWSQQCFCGTALENGATVASESQCSMACSGAANELCGNGNIMSVYSEGPLAAYGVPAAQTTGLPGNYQYVGCMTDVGAANRTLFWQSILTSTNDAQTCLTACAAYGYNAAGMEYGDECYCGDVGDPAKVGATLVPDAQCNIVCSGNPQTICGGNNLLSYYTWTTGTPLHTFSYPQGTAAGAYEYLLNGPVVPLITTPGINGAVIFVEKSGTSLTPGSTGAYELDLDLLTFRTMSVKTDVFCSASLQLPDRVGRQINVGGWSGTSTYGVRLYWPNGSPGVPGTNNWQENQAELSLQIGRWYPSAVVMANGSILVVGGEDGSNGAPVPSMEILPQVGPTVFAQWLQDTDPYNLYPFLVVLPSGHIFVAYYNQARILDQTSLQTITQLANIPGSVNNAASGRTYPLEGTLVILPQHAPYSDPLGVLICGGSSPYQGYAIDNCVSTTPETGAAWVIEKMVSLACKITLVLLY